MDRVLFSITCTTCEARLNVRDASAVGTIVNCPKCESMVQVTAPPGWQAPSEEPVQQEKPDPRAPAPRVEKPRRQPAEPPTPKPERTAASKSQAEAQPSSPAGSEEPAPKPPAKPKKSPSKKAAGASAAGVAASAAAASGSEPPPATTTPSAEASPPEPAEFDGTAEMDAPPVQQPVEMEALPGSPVTQWASPAEATMRRWLVWGAGPAAGLVMVLGIWTLFFSGNAAEPQPAPNPPGPEVIDTGGGQPVPTPLPEFDVHWVPDSPQFVLSLDIADNEAVGQLSSLLKAVPALNQAIVSELFQGFGLKPNAVDHLNWSSADLSDWSGTGVVVIRLAEGQSTAPLRSAGAALSWQVEGIEFRRLDRPTWSRAYAVLDERTLVTGEEGILRQLAERAEGHADLGLLDPLLNAAPTDADFFVALELRAAAQAGWPMPAQWLDVWPQGRDAWQVIWGLPSALSLSFDHDDLALAELGLLCDGDTVADKVRVALEQWIPQAESVLSTRIKGLPASVEAGEIPAESAAVYRTALNGASAALASSRLEVFNRCVWLRADCGGNSSAWAAAAAGSRAAMRADWYEAARACDEASHGRLHGAVTEYSQVEKKAPAGAINSGALPPESVLSWLTSMLPYLGHEQWAKDLDRSYSWDSRKNRPVTMRTLGAVQNPAVGVRETASGYPVSHYVGVAGIGAGAADLSRDDPRAGIFGYRESRPLSNVPDGASNTIATAGVTDGLGSWASGGAPTVRAFTQQPYINGPDGFGSGQPGGMYVGMADGSARFLSANIDPTVLEHLATAAGGETVPVFEPPTEPVVKVEPEPAMPPDTVPAPAETPDVSEPEEPVVEPGPNTVVEVAERLQGPLPGVVMTNTPLRQAIRAIENYGSVLVTLDLDTMSASGVPLDKPVSLHLTEATVGTALARVLASCGLKAVVRDNQVWVTGAGQASELMQTVPYSVSDLALPGLTSAADLASWLPRLIAPETWQTNGGQGTVEVKGGALKVRQTGAVHLEVLVFCERLRVARGLSPRSGRPAERFPLTPRRVRAATILGQPITVNFFRPTALERVLDELDRAGAAQIAVNWLALAAEGKSPSLPTSLTGSQIPLSDALNRMLEPHGLDYRAVDGRTIEVTTRAAADAHFEREFYPIGDLVIGGQAAEALTARLCEEIEVGGWESSGGEGVVVFDEPSRHLIVLQTQRGQVAVGRWLNGLRAEQKAARDAAKD